MGYYTMTSKQLRKLTHTTIKVKNTTRDRLAKRGTKAHTYDLVIVELLDLVENNWSSISF